MSPTASAPVELIELMEDLRFLFPNQDGSFGDREVIYGDVARRAYDTIERLTAQPSGELIEVVAQDDGSVLITNEMVQRLMDHGLFHFEGDKLVIGDIWANYRIAAMSEGVDRYE